WRYRNKAQFPVGRRGGQVVVGFFRRGSHQIVPSEDCLIQSEAVVRAAQLAPRLAQAAGLLPFDATTHEGDLRHLVVRAAVDPAPRLRALAPRTPGPGAGAVTQGLVAGLPQLVGLVQNGRPERTSRILGPEERIPWGRPYLEERLGPFRSRLGVQSFFQV